LKVEIKDKLKEYFKVISLDIVSGFAFILWLNFNGIDLGIAVNIIYPVMLGALALRGIWIFALDKIKKVIQRFK